MIGYVCQATLDPGDEIVTPWPSFPSYVLDPLKLGAATRPRPARRRPDRRRRAARGGHASGRSSSSCRPPNNPTGTMIAARRAARVFVDGRPRARAHGRRRGVLRVRRRPVVPGRDRGGREARRAACSRCGRSRRSTAWPGCASATASAPAPVIDGDPQGAARVRRDDARAGGGAREPRRRGRARPAPRRQPRGDGGARGVLRERRLRADRARRSATSSSSTSARTRRALNDALLRRGVIVRPMGRSARRRRSGSRPGTPDEIAFLADAARRGLLEVLTTPSGRVGYRSCASGARRPRLAMRTTLKRGVGRGAALERQRHGRCRRRRRSRRSRSTGSRPPPPRSGRSLVAADPRLAALVLAVLVGGTAGGAYLYLHESVAAVAPRSVEVKQALKRSTSRSRASRQPRS